MHVNTQTHNTRDSLFAPRSCWQSPVRVVSFYKVNIFQRFSLSLYIFINPNFHFLHNPHFRLGKANPTDSTWGVMKRYQGGWLRTSILQEAARGQATGQNISRNLPISAALTKKHDLSCIKLQNKSFKDYLQARKTSTFKTLRRQKPL